jgi:hypothetical protein
VGTNLNIPVPVRGEIDTRNPITDRAPGTLVTARDLHPSHWGPRRGSLSFTRAWESPGTALLYDIVNFTQATTTYALGGAADEHYRDMGTKFTVDVWFRLEDTGYAAGQTNISVFTFYAGGNVGGNPGVFVSVTGPAHASPNKVTVGVRTAPDRSTIDSLVTLTSSTSVLVGTAQKDISHVRVVRDGANAYLYLNGVLEASSAGVVASSGVLGGLDGRGSVGVCFGAGGVGLKGTFYLGVVRDGSFRTQPIESVPPTNPLARNVHAYVVGSQLATGGAAHLTDLSRFAVHPKVVGSALTFSGANSNSAPANARVQGFRSWTTRGGKVASAALVGGVLTVATAT